MKSPFSILHAALLLCGLRSFPSMANERLPLYLWVNDDNDAGEFASSSATDLPGQSSQNGKDGVVNGHRDLLDFFPVLLDFGNFTALAPDAQFSIRLKQADSAVNVVFTRHPANHAGDFLTQNLGVNGQSWLTSPVNAAAVTQVTQAGIDVHYSFLDHVLQNPQTGCIILEGRTKSSSPLVMEMYADGTLMASVDLPLQINPVEEMFNRLDLRNGKTSVTLGNAVFPYILAEKKYVFFVHGFNVNNTEAREWGAEMFKRLWQSGSHARFYSVTWDGDIGWPNAFFYHQNVANAFDAASRLAAYVNRLDPSIPKIFIAHSLGNMVVASAIADHGMAADKFFMVNAAVSAEALDVFQWNDGAALNPLVNHTWAGYASRTWCSTWHQLFTSPDDRAALTWRDRFSNINPSLLYNYYSSGDEILSIHNASVVNSMIVVNANTGYSLGNFAWQKQERFKGRALFDPIAGFAASSAAGWGFRYTVSTTEDGYDIYYPFYSVADANNLSDTQLRGSPVFLPVPSFMFTNTITTSDHNILLAHGIPALSTPIGSTAIANVIENHDLNDSDIYKYRPNGWPRNHPGYQNAWLHSDIKDVAYFYNHKFFQELVITGGLK